MILVDTSVWIDHINKGGLDHLYYLLDGESVLTHPMIIGEIAMGSLKNRKAQLAMLSDLHRIPVASDFEVRTLVESAKLYGTGLSYIDAHLLASALAQAVFEPIRIWTGDGGMHDQAELFGIAYHEPIG
jgi:predicted nucleic acid-binding protein